MTSRHGLKCHLSLSPYGYAGDRIHNGNNGVMGTTLARYIGSAFDCELLISARAFFNDLSGSLDLRYAAKFLGVLDE